MLTLKLTPSNEISLPFLDIGRSWSGVFMPVQFLFIACALLQEQPSQDGSRLNDISTEDGQLLLKSKKKEEKEKKKGCVCVKKMKGAATAHWVEKDIT